MNLSLAFNFDTKFSDPAKMVLLTLILHITAISDVGPEIDIDVTQKKGQPPKNRADLHHSPASLVTRK